MANPISDTQVTSGIPLVDVDSVRENRGWFIGLGLVFMVLGALAIVLPFAGSLVTALVIGWLLVIAGVTQGIHAFRSPRWANRGWAIASAVIQVIAGLLVVAFPLSGTLSLTLILAAFLAAEGVLRIVRAVQHRSMPAWGWLLFDGILSLVLGILILAGWPSTAVWALGLLVGINLVFGGSSMLLLGLTAGEPSHVRTY
ncbi:Hypothetical protein A7982_10696 [Minicystis rosea]|nr:Hypothetical protein A7982_10696 [Minicystis rosea]